MPTGERGRCAGLQDEATALVRRIAPGSGEVVGRAHHWRRPERNHAPRPSGPPNPPGGLR